MIFPEEHDRIIAAKDAQIAALEKTLGEAQAEAAELRGRVQGLEQTVDALAKARRCVFAVAFITNERDEVLLIHNRNRNGWELPGGAVEPNEDPRDAALREAEEEAGVKARLDPLPCAVLPGPNGVAIVYRGRAEEPVMFGDDADAVAWFAVDEIPWDNLSRIGSAEVVKQWADAQEMAEKYAEYGCEPRPVYLVCPGNGCVGSGISTRERACPNCGKECVPYPSASNLAAAEQNRRAIAAADAAKDAVREYKKDPDATEGYAMDALAIHPAIVAWERSTYRPRIGDPMVRRPR